LANGEVSALRDLQFGQALDYPIRQVQIDRERAGQLRRPRKSGARCRRVVQSLRDMNYWADPDSGIAYQVQV
jgi:hypothetical protein